MKQILDKLSCFYNHAMTKFKTLIGVLYAFCKQPDILDYMAKLLEKDKFSSNNIENVSNQKYHYRDFYTCRPINYI